MARKRGGAKLRGLYANMFIVYYKLLYYILQIKML